MTKRSIQPIGPGAEQGQVAIILILAVIIILIGGTFLYLSSSASKTTSSTQVQSGAGFDQITSNIQTYVEGCIGMKATPLIIDLAKHGGRFDPASEIFSNGTEVHAFCEYIRGQGCVSTITTKNSLERELAEKLKEADQIPICLNLQEQFKSAGATIETLSPPLIRVNISTDTVYVTIDYTVKISRGANARSIPTFSTSVDAPLGRLLGTALDITNAIAAGSNPTSYRVDGPGSVGITATIASSGTFDTSAYMASHDSTTLITVDRPYPHTVYKLTRVDPKTGAGSQFQFAIKGERTAGEEAIQNRPANGCCFAHDTTCHLNAPSGTCAGIGTAEGIGCRCPSNPPPVAEGCCIKTTGGSAASGGAGTGSCGPAASGDCAGAGSTFIPNDRTCSGAQARASGTCANLDCPDTYTITTNNHAGGRPRKHGESWCVYEGRVGSGNDLVGSRHYVHSCWNGKEIVEPCRDYREELCAEDNHQTPGGGTLSHAACRINRYADCTSQRSDTTCLDRTIRDCEWLPGRPEFQGKPIYNVVKCIPVTAPGLPFFDTKGEGLCTEVSRDDIPPDTRHRTWGYFLAGSCQSAGDCGAKRNIADTLTINGFFDPDGDIDPGRLLGTGSIRQAYTGLNLPLASTSLPPTLPSELPMASPGSFATCGLWQAPASGDCSLCESNPWHPCTAYKCKSIGQNCQADEVIKGVTRCRSGPPIPVIPPTATITSSNPLIMAGTLNRPILPFEPWNLFVETDQPARCKVTLLPAANPTASWGMSPPSSPRMWMKTSFYLSDGSYSTKTNISARFPRAPLEKTIPLYIRCANRQGKDSANTVVRARFNLSAPAPDKAPSIIAVNPPPQSIPSTSPSIGRTTSVEAFTDQPFDSCTITPPGETAQPMSCPAIDAPPRQSMIFMFPPGRFRCASTMTLKTGSYTIACTNNAGAGTSFVYAPVKAGP